MVLRMKLALAIWLATTAVVQTGSLSKYEWTEGQDEDMFTDCSYTMNWPVTVNGVTTMTDVTVGGISAGDTAVMMFGTTLVMFQTPAMGIAQAGMIRRKNSLSMMMQCMSGMAVGSLLWYIVGYSMTFGPSKLGGLIGNPATFFFFRQMPTSSTKCLSIAPHIPGTIFASFQMMFALMVPVIITGAWAEKLTMKAFFVFIILWPLMVYYPIAHWLWGGGWLSGIGAIDFAGGVTIHTVAGVAAMVVSLMLQKRRNIEKLQMTHHNIPLLVIGGTIVWAGWYSFNGCSALAANATASLALLNTHISASVSGLTWVMLTYRQDKCFHVTDAINGAFAGLAGITPGSGFVASQGAFCIGLCVGVASWSTAKLLKSEWIYIDDVLDVFSLQCTPGSVGSFLVGFFRADAPEYGYDKEGDPDGKSLGIFYGGNGELLGAQIIAILSAMILSACSTFVIMKIIKKTVGTDITWEEEEAGLDKSQIGEIGYDYVSTANDEQMDTEDLTQALCEAAARGNFGKCKNLVRAGASVSKGDYDKRTPLHLAAAEGRLEICKWMIDSGAVINSLDNFGRSPLEEAVLNQQETVCTFLEGAGGQMDDSHVIGLLCEAAFDGDLVQCNKLTNRVASSVQTQDYDGRTALHVAVCEKNMSCAQLLLKKGANPQTRDRWGQSPLDNATSLNLTEFIPFLADPSKCPAVITAEDGEREQLGKSGKLQGVVPSNGDTDKMSSYKEFLKLACAGSLPEIKNLVEKGANPAEGDYDKRTPLHIAAANGHGGVVKYLIKVKTVNINAVDRFRFTPLADALKSKSKEVIEILKRSGGTVMNSGYGSTLCAAAARNDIAKLQEMCDSGIDLATGDYDGRTALHLAVCNGFVDTVKFLMKNIDVGGLSVIDRMHNTPLDDARQFGQKECHVLLLDAGAISGAVGGIADKVVPFQ